MTQRASFIVTGPVETVVAQGIRTGYDDVDTAAAALRHGRAELIVGALPFDMRHAAALIEPISVSATLPTRPDAAMPAVRIVETLPTPQVHRSRIIAALQQLRDRENPLEKVVLARALRLRAEDPLDPLTILYRRDRISERSVCGGRALRRCDTAGSEPRTSGRPHRRPGLLSPLRRIGAAQC